MKDKSESAAHGSSLSSLLKDLKVCLRIASMVFRLLALAQRILQLIVKFKELL
jgi:hypothetical protein